MSPAIWVLGRLEHHLGLAVGSLSLDTDLSTLGIESTVVFAITEELAEAFEVDVDPSMIYGHRTVRAMEATLNDGPRPEDRDDRHRPNPDGPVAIVGAACRLPAASSLVEFWDVMLGEGRDAKAAPEFPPRSVAGGLGYFLSAPDHFDAEFFGIPAGEAAQIDPQHRLLLELSKEAFDDAGIATTTKDVVGVFVSTGPPDYAAASYADGATIDARTATALAASGAANRLSYVFDFDGPSIVVDTACSSSLIAALMAVHAIERGECELAVVGGSNLLLEDVGWRSLTQAGVLSPTGRCRTFSSDADGYVRSEGGVVLLLKRLDRAMADKDRVYATVLGGSTNHDGRSNGIMAPNPRAQERLLRAACASAGVDPGHVAYVEAHGTGTVLGDLVETKALAKVVGSGRTNPCFVGSAKSQVGHLEAAAGAVGLLRTALALYHGVLPRSANVVQPNPHASFGSNGLAIVTDPIPLPTPSEPVIAGVSSFGFGGSNAHLVLQAPVRSAAPHAAPAVAAPFVLPVSAYTGDALETMSATYAALLSKGQSSVEAVCAAAAVRRDHYRFRRAAVGRNLQSLRANLEQQRSTAPHGAARRLAFVFPGHGAVWDLDVVGLDRCLPGFGDHLEECDEILAELLGVSVVDAIEVGKHTTGGPVVSQAAHFATQVALGQSWITLGIEPDTVVGHSAGEIAAAHVAGLLSLQSAARLIVERGRAIERCAPEGCLLHVERSERDALRWARAQGLTDACVAAVNGPGSTVLSIGGGVPHEALLGDTARALDTVHFKAHSPQMEAAGAALGRAVAGIVPTPARYPLVSSVTGRPVGDGELGTDYWVSNLVQTVRFQEATTTLVDSGCSAFLEVSARSSLLGAISNTSEEAGVEPPSLVASIRSGDPESTRQAVARLYEIGQDPHWDLLVQRPPHVELPGYPWNWVSHWRGRSESVLRDTYDGPDGEREHLLVRLASNDESHHAEVLLGWVCELVAMELACPPAEVTGDQSIADIGLDSLGATSIRNQLRDAIGAKIQLSELLGEASLWSVVEGIISTLASDPDYRHLLAEARELLAEDDEVDR